MEPTPTLTQNTVLPLEMYVIKRDGRQEKVHFDKITSRIKKLCYGLNETFVDPVEVAQKVCCVTRHRAHGHCPIIHIHILERRCAWACTRASPPASWTSWRRKRRRTRRRNTLTMVIVTFFVFVSMHSSLIGLLAARIAVSDLHKKTSKNFIENITLMHNYVESKTGLPAPLIASNVYEFIMANKDAISSSIIYDRDFLYDFFGFKTLERSYLLKMHGVVAERPQQMLMRVACGIHCGDLEAAIETYNYLSLGVCVYLCIKLEMFFICSGSFTRRPHCSMLALRARNCHPVFY